MTTTNIMQDAV